MSAIHHIEMNVSDVARSCDFYKSLLLGLGWKELRPGMYLKDGCEVYLKAAAAAGSGPRHGPRHVCFRAASRDEVDRTAALLKSKDASILRGPLAMPEYGATYYTVDFRDPDGFVLEVAHD
jgi:catechol 2,3-dioxygenase-like lactoylglutathione lyase family enzyme